MTTYIIYSDPNDGYIRSTDANFATAQAGSNLTVDSAGNYIMTGLNSDSAGVKYIYEGFISFDTSAIADTDEIIDATITQYSGYDRNQSSAWGQQFLAYDWGTTLSASAWRTQAQLAALPLVANFDYLFTSTPFGWRSTGRDTLVSSISKTAATKFVVANSVLVAGMSYSTGVMENWISSGNTTNKPYLTVYTEVLNTLNGVSEASTTLPDGTTVGVRSDGTSNPVLSVGYTPLNGSWTLIQNLSSDFTNTIDGPGSITITNDPAGNFFIFGVKSGTTGFVVGQAFQKLTATTWSAKNTIWQPLAAGNESTIRSLSATYAKGGSDANDQPEIYLMAIRGSNGNRPNFPYHVPGAGWAQDSHVLPSALLAGTGAMFRKTNNAYAPHNASGIPAAADMVALDSNTMAVYIPRSKFGGVSVGGVSTIKIYNQEGYTLANDSTYIATGSSQLVPINSTMFAHVFNYYGAARCTVRFYNAACQIVGETYIARELFYGQGIDDQFSAYYDKTANLVRVFFVDVSSSRTFSRFDVSPVTFTGQVTTAVATNVGPVSSTNTDLRVSRTSDERRVLIESANNSAGVLSTVSTFSTVGNVAPMAPALTTRQNFDATSAATFTWKPGDANAADYQTAYQLEVSRVSDSVVAYDSGKIISTISSASVAASTLTNGIPYRWRVRTYDVIDTVGTWSAYGTFTTAATGTLTITAPAADNQTGIDTSDYTVTWNYTQSGGQTQAQRQVRLIRTSDSAVLVDTTMQANTTNSYYISGMESGKEYRVEVSLVNSASVSVPVVSRLITPNYSQPMTPSLVINQKDSYIELIAVNPTPSGNRPEVIYNDIYKRVSKAGSVASDFKRIAIINNSATYRDYAVKSGASYDYYIVGRTA